MTEPHLPLRGARIEQSEAHEREDEHPVRVAGRMREEHQHKAEDAWRDRIGAALRLGDASNSRY